VKARSTLSLCAVVLVGCSPAKSPAADSTRFFNATGELASEPSKWIVSTSGIGPVQFGMTLADAGRAIHDSAFAASQNRAPCAYVRPKALPSGASLMVSNGIVVRVDVDSEGVLTDTGLGIGDSEVAVLVRNSGRARIESNKYNARVHNLIVSNPTDPGRLMIFETDGRSIKQFRAGLRSAVELVERCG
jgi:hypothetical protein